jgi:hypothetical protein
LNQQVSKGHRWQKGQSGNPAGRAVGARQKISERLLADLASVWETHGESVVSLAITEPGKLAQIAYGLLPRDVFISVETRTGHLQLITSCNVNRKVDPVLRRGSNADLRTREYLTPAEIEKLSKPAKDGRWGHRDATLVLVAYRHGLRAKETCELEWSQVEFGRSACLHVRRAKNGKPSVHPIRGDELRMLTTLRKENPDSGYVFTAERGDALYSGRNQPAGQDPRRRAKLPFPTISTCCANAADTRWPMMAPIPGRFRTGSAIVRSRIRCATPS